MRRATKSKYHNRQYNEFQSTLSVRRATICCRCICSDSKISIHALREESDFINTGMLINSGIISIHALREESDIRDLKTLRSEIIFQSTLSVRRATHHSTFRQVWAPISIHALREESDIISFGINNQFEFQSTLSVRRATATRMWVCSRTDISIHALREESDRRNKRLEHTVVISIHALREESDVLTLVIIQILASKFQSTLSVRRATFHHLSSIKKTPYFNPRSP